MIKKLIISSLIAISVIGVAPVAASAEWKEDSHKEYSWVENGAVVKEWKQIDGQWYNFGNNGIMKTGWMMDNGSWYYLWSNGSMASNSWLNNGGFWYYFDASGKMVSDTVIIENKKYDFNATAIIISEQATTSAAVNIDTTSSNN